MSNAEREEAEAALGGQPFDFGGSPSGQIFGQIDVFGQRDGGTGGPNDPNFTWDLWNQLSNQSNQWSVPTAGTGAGDVGLSAGSPLTAGAADIAGFDDWWREYVGSEDPLTDGSIEDRTARRFASVYEQFGEPGLQALGFGESPSSNTPIGGPNDPNFTWDLWNQLSNQSEQNMGTAPGSVHTPAPDPTAVPALPGEPSEPLLTLEDQIRQWFESNPNASAQDVFDAMQQGSVSPEDVISAMGFDHDSAMAQYNTFLNPAQEDPQARETTFNNAALGSTEAPLSQDAEFTQNPFQYVKGAIAGAIEWLFNSPDVFVINPFEPSATVVWGQPSGAPYIPVPNPVPHGTTQTGVTTGVPIIDKIINGVFGKSGQSGPVSVEDVIGVVIDQVIKQTGVPASVVEAVLGDDIDKAVRVLVDTTVNKSREASGEGAGAGEGTGEGTGEGDEVGAGEGSGSGEGDPEYTDTELEDIVGGGEGDPEYTDPGLGDIFEGEGDPEVTLDDVIGGSGGSGGGVPIGENPDPDAPPYTGGGNPDGDDNEFEALMAALSAAGGGGGGGAGGLGSGASSPGLRVTDPLLAEIKYLYDMRGILPQNLRDGYDEDEEGDLYEVLFGRTPRLGSSARRKS